MQAAKGATKFIENFEYQIFVAYVRNNFLILHDHISNGT